MVSLMIMTLLAGWAGSSGQKSWEGWEGKHWSWDGMAGRGKVGKVVAPLPLLCQPHHTLPDYTVVLSRQLWGKVNNYLMTRFQRLSFVHYDAASKQFSNLLCTVVHV